VRAFNTVLRHVLVLALLVLLLPAQAHESLPASLTLEEIAPHEFDVYWRTPALQSSGMALAPRLPGDCRMLEAPQDSYAPGARLSRWRVRCAQGLGAGARIAIEGLQTSLVDVLVHVSRADGSSATVVASPRQPEVLLPDMAARGLAVRAYFGLGVEHILTGIDHLLFVLCLILLVRGGAALLKTITAFTLAHSATLALSALGWIHVPQPPVEAVIALSILCLACELAGAKVPCGAAPRAYWGVAFAFGLLHGFGFAGALAEVGLPAHEVPAALLLFNLGVEAGQLMFVVPVLALLAIGRRLPVPAVLPRRMDFAVNVIGAVAAFWWLQRMAAVLGLDIA
jgi:hydrogenase/urease accessory protein HupE